MAESVIGVNALDRVLELAPARIITVGGFDYIDKDKTATLFKPPVLTALSMVTLSSFAALIDAKFETYPVDGVVVQVESFDTVHLIAMDSDKWGRRQVYLTATALKPERTFEFNKFLKQEEFNIALMSMFVDDDAAKALLGITGNLAEKTELRQQDDGFTQEVTTKAGVVRMAVETVKSRVTLRPFRTFTEIEQPAGEFICRVASSPTAGNMVALFEADAGAWKNVAMDSVASWLGNKLKGSAVEGVGDIPVVS